MQQSPISHRTYFQFAGIGIVSAVVAVVVVWLVATLISPDMYVKDSSGDYAKLTVFGAATAAIFYSVVATAVGWVFRWAFKAGSGTSCRWPRVTDPRCRI